MANEVRQFLHNCDRCGRKSQVASASKISATAILLIIPEKCVSGRLRSGAKATRSLCRDIAGRVAGAGAFADVVSIEIRTDTFDVVAYFDGSESKGPESPLEAKVHATCKVVRP